jgi:hypothetical protein
MDILETKWIVLVALFGSTFVFSMLPLKLVSSVRSTEDRVKRGRLVMFVSVLCSVHLCSSIQFISAFVILCISFHHVIRL